MAKADKDRTNHREVELLAALRRVGGSARTANLAEVLGVSEETVRRTAKSLAKADLVNRVHGGLYLANAEAEHSVFTRLGHRPSEKHKIAEAAASLIPNGACIFLDVGSTTAFVAEALRGHKKLTVVTNSINIAQTLLNRNKNRVFLCGGELCHTEGGAFGPEALDYLRHYFFDFAILSVDGVDAQGGFLLRGSDEADMAAVVIERARHKIIVADHLKFGQTGPRVVCDPVKVNTFVTDRPLSSGFAHSFDGWGIDVVAVEKGQLN